MEKSFYANFANERQFLVCFGLIFATEAQRHRGVEIFKTKAPEDWRTPQRKGYGSNICHFNHHLFILAQGRPRSKVATTAIF
jgi:hypothetical protein